jgi:hypothetical protein
MVPILARAEAISSAASALGHVAAAAAGEKLCLFDGILRACGVQGVVEAGEMLSDLLGVKGYSAFSERSPVDRSLETAIN